MSETKMSLGVQAVGDSDVARRIHNEDAFNISADSGLVIVADGVGGHLAGGVASALTCETIGREIKAGRSLQDAVRESNRVVLEAVEAGEGKVGMASTVVAAVFNEAEYEIAWVGDSRAYWWNGDLHLLTQDHSFVAAELEKGRLTIEQARNHPRKNVIVQAIGLQKNNTLRVDINRGTLAAGETLLLCSDGLNDVLTSAQIAEILGSGESIEKQCEGLIKLTLAEGGKDNVTVLLVAASAQSNTSQGKPPNSVWTFHPVNGQYSGLPEQQTEPVTKLGVTRVSPKAQSATQMMPVAQVEAMRKLALKKSNKVRRNLIATIVAIGVMATAAFWLVSIGIFK